MISTDILVIGGGAAGMAAAHAAARQGARIVLAEQSFRLGGILNRCTHHGFGLGYYDEDITGLEYSGRYRAELIRYTEGTSDHMYAKAAAAADPQKKPLGSIRVMKNTTVLEVRPDRTALLSSFGRIEEVSFIALVLATGSYEVPLESALIAGTRPAGVMTAGCAQGLINQDGMDIGSEIVILGSGNVGQIMAGQLADAGKTIVAMVEQNDAPGGLARNVREYIEGRNIPLILNSTVSRIHGSERITGVTVRNLISGEETFLSCDTLISALGLIPDRSLVDCLKGNCTGGDSGLPDWVFLAGNCDMIYDFVDAVTSAGEQTGAMAAAFCDENGGSK